MSQQEPGPSPLIGKSLLYRKTTFCFPPSICWWISGLFPPCGSSRWCCLNMSVHVFASVFRPLGETPVSGVAHRCHVPAVLQTGLHVVVGWSFFFFSKNIVFLHIHEHALYKRYTCSRSKCWKLQKTVSVGVCNTGECNWHIWLFIKSLGSWCPPLPPLFSLLSWLPSVSPPHLWIPAPPQGTPAGSWPTADAVSL